MNGSLLKNKNAHFILLYLFVMALIYAVDIFPLAYRLTPWRSFGGLPIQPSRLAYFQADTPNIISYREPGAVEPVTCAEAVAYLEMNDGNVTRCCQAETKVSCLPGNYNNEIPPPDEACIDILRATFGVEESLPVFAECPEGGNPRLTVVQVNAEWDITWKTITMFEPGIVSGILRCVLAPLLLGLAVRAFLLMRRKPNPSRQIRHW